MNFLLRRLITSSFILFLLIAIPLKAKADISEDIEAIKSKLELNLPPIKAKKISATPIPGLYEVFVNGSIIYSDRNFSYALVDGSLVDIAKKKNLSEDRLKELTSINFYDLPFENAIEIIKGNGAYKFAIFTDPDCPHCRQLEKSITQSIASDYTAYIFLYPLTQLHPNAALKSQHIWCAKNPREAWANLMINDVEPEPKSCDNPISANLNLAKELSVIGTPTIYSNKGEVIPNFQALFVAIEDEKKKKLP
jgi:thiol:disulfide interchange protein DsbC